MSGTASHPWRIPQRSYLVSTTACIAVDVIFRECTAHPHVSYFRDAVVIHEDRSIVASMKAVMTLIAHLLLVLLLAAAGNFEDFIGLLIKHRPCVHMKMAMSSSSNKLRS